MAGLRQGAAVLALIGGFAAANGVRAEGDPAYGEYLSGTCVTCHGSATGSIPPIEDLPYDYFVMALEEYREGVRSNPAMASVAQGLGDEEIAALAAFYAR